MSHITNLVDLDVTSRLIDCYEERFGDLILKSTFTVDLIKDGFILPNGDVVKTEQWCHNHIAHNFIDKYTDEQLMRVRKTEAAIHQLESKSVLSREDEFFLDKLKRDYQIQHSAPNYLQLFNEVSKVRGFDAAEFVVIYLGFLGISEGHLIYNKRNVNTIQIRKVKCDYEYEGEYKIIIKR